MSSTGTKPAAREPDTTADPLPLLKAFGALRRLTEMYPPGHPMITQKLDELDEIVQRHVRQGRALGVHVIHGDVFLDGTAWRPDTQATEQVIQDLVELGIHSIEMRPGVTRQELATVADFMWRARGAGDGEPIERQLDQRGVRHVTLGRIVPLDTRWRGDEYPEAPTGPIDPDYAQSLDMAQKTFDTVSAGRPIDVTTVRDLVHLLVEKVARSNAALAQILAVKEYENLTYCHSVNVAMISLLLGRRLGMDEETTGALVEGALLHDIGKTRVPVEIVKKPGVLDARERKVIENHTFFGAEILVETKGVRPLTPTVALEHHRRSRGGGYPDVGDGVPHALTQIVSVADVYEAVTGARSYQKPRPPEQACAILARLAGDQLNSAVVKAFVNAISFFPIGSLVRTSRDERAIVVRTNPTDPLHPVVVLVSENGDSPRPEIDTSARDASGAYERHILETLTPREGEIDLSSYL
ncbi:MAG: HD-GYP domain-containing protein [Bacteroidales bacterium]